MKTMLVQMAEFHLIDLISQAPEVEKRLHGLSVDEKIGWLAAHGSLTSRLIGPTDHRVFFFEAASGIKCSFFFNDDKLVFFGDHTTFIVPPRE